MSSMYISMQFNFYVVTILMTIQLWYVIYSVIIEIFTKNLIIKWFLKSRDLTKHVFYEANDWKERYILRIMIHKVHILFL